MNAYVVQLVETLCILPPSPTAPLRYSLYQLFLLLSPSCTFTSLHPFHPQPPPPHTHTHTLLPPSTPTRSPPTLNPHTHTLLPPSTPTRSPPTLNPHTHTLLPPSTPTHTLLPPSIPTHTPPTLPPVVCVVGVPMALQGPNMVGGKE